jgi:hypothetical protein
MPQRAKFYLIVAVKKPYAQGMQISFSAGQHALNFRIEGNRPVGYPLRIERDALHLGLGSL